MSASDRDDPAPDLVPTLGPEVPGAAPAPSSRSDGLRLGLAVIGGSVALQFFTLLSGIASARLLGPEGRGVLAFVLAAVMFSTQLTYGGSLPVSLAKLVAQRGVSARDAWRGVIGRYWWVLVIPAAAGAGALLALDSSDGSAIALLMALTGSLCVLSVIGKLILAGVQGEAQRLGLMAVVANIPQAVFAATLGVALWRGWQWDASDVTMTFAASSVIGLVAWWLCLRRPTGEAGDVIEPSTIWRESRANYVGSVKPLDTLGIDRISIGATFGTVALGLYAAALSVANLGGIIGNAVSTIALPHVARSHGDRAALRSIVMTWVGFTVACAAALVVVLQLLVEPIITVAFGPEFDDAVAVARWLIIADAAFAVRKVLVSVLQGLGRGSTASWIELLLTPLLVGGLVLAARADELVLAGVAVLSVAAASCLALGVAVAGAMRHRRSDPVPEG